MKISARDAYDRLFKYFGLRARDGYLSAVGGGTPEPQVTDARVLGDVYHILYGDENQNFDIEEICKKINEMPGKLNYSKDIICVTPYSDSPNDLGISNFSNFPINDKKITGYADQGLTGNGGNTKKTSEIAPKLYTIKGMNKRFNNDHNRVDVIQIFPSKGISELADTDILTLYLSTINSVNMSQALPYVDVLVSVQGQEDSSISSQAFSFGSFLGSPTDRAMNSKFIDQSLSGAGIEKTTDASGKVTTRKIESVASMEIFTSPQTLVNATPESIRYNENVNSGRHIDIFRPFLAIESLSVSVIPAGAGLIAFKTANMKLRLFDRGRLNQIAPLVAPSRFGVVKFDIEYGWSHPGGGTKTSGRQADANDDRIGQLIDSMRVTESYQVVNSNFSFEQDGSVSIELKLSMLGIASLSNFSLKFSSDDTSTEEIEKLLYEIQQLLSDAPKKINVPSVISGGADTFVRISDQDVADLKKFIGSLLNRKNKVSNSAKLAASSISKLIVSKSGNKSKLELFRQTKNEQVQKFINELQQADDPFIRTIGLPNTGCGVTAEELTGKDNTSYASLGSIIVNTLGPIFQNIGDVIFIFNCFNRNAGAMFDHNIAQLPIRLTGGAGKSDKSVNLQNVLKREMKKTTKITPEMFLSILNEFFLLRESTEAYGLSDLYRDTPVFEDGGQIKDEYAKNVNLEAGKAESQLVFEQKKIDNLAKIYGPNRKHPTFTIPRITMKIDVKPGSKGGNIVKIIIFDQACSNVGDIQEAFDEITANGFFEKDDFGNPKAANSRSAKHGDTANVVFDKLIATQMFEKYKPSEPNPQNPKENDEPTLLQQLEKKAANGGPIEKFETDDAKRENLHKKLNEIYFMKKQGSNDAKLREVFYQLFPVIIYGTMGSGVISAQLSSNQNPALTTIALQKQGDDPDIPSGLPMLIHPTQLSMDVFGTPMFKYSQKFFIDFGTGTSADNFYVVGGVDMNFGPGEFKTNLKMIQLDVFGRFMKTRDTILKTLINSYRSDKK